MPVWFRPHFSKIAETAEYIPLNTGHVATLSTLYHLVSDNERRLTLSSGSSVSQTSSQTLWVSTVTQWNDGRAGGHTVQPSSRHCCDDSRYDIVLDLEASLPELAALNVHANM